jgi:hypothetical protein
MDGMSLRNTVSVFSHERRVQLGALAESVVCLFVYWVYRGSVAYKSRLLMCMWMLSVQISGFGCKLACYQSFAIARVTTVTHKGLHCFADHGMIILATSLSTICTLLLA